VQQSQVMEKILSYGDFSTQIPVLIISRN
jgi:hypothetical protein